ncbi:MAG: helix-hairpin-helix domain-containing protein [bacterium]
MLEIPRQQQYVLIFLIIVMILAGGVILWHQQRTRQLVIADLSPVTLVEEVAEPEVILVHVAGAVVNRGVYDLPLGSRVIDAIEAAGGGTDAANIHALNLAALLRDEDYIYVPTMEEETIMSGVNAVANNTGKINLNRASKEELETLPGIGPALASRIITYRETNGPFRRVDELKKVSGIGDVRFEELKDLVTAP